MVPEIDDIPSELGPGSRVSGLKEALQDSGTNAGTLSARSDEVVRAFRKLENLRSKPSLSAEKEDRITDRLAAYTSDYAEAMGRYAFDLCLIIDRLEVAESAPLPKKIQRIGSEIDKEARLRQGTATEQHDDLPVSKDGILTRLARTMEELDELGISLEPNDVPKSEQPENPNVALLRKTYAKLKAEAYNEPDNDVLRVATAQIVERQVVEEHYLMNPLRTVAPAAA